MPFISLLFYIYIEPALNGICSSKENIMSNKLRNKIHSVVIMYLRLRIFPNV